MFEKREEWAKASREMRFYVLNWSKIEDD